MRCDNIFCDTSEHFQLSGSPDVNCGIGRSELLIAADVVAVDDDDNVGSGETLGVVTIQPI